MLMNRFAFLLFTVFPLINAIADDAKPNLVFMIADDCTYLDLEVYGGQAKTPTLNKLATQGMTFSRCFQTAPMCSPTRHNLYTGIYPVKSGAWPNHTRVYDGTKSIVHYLKDAGYRVALSGKTHINPKESFPFEYSDDFRSGDPTAENPYPRIASLLKESKAANTPFCLFACSNEPHSPWNKGDRSAYPPKSLTLPPSWVDTPATRLAYSKYLAEITYYDQQCGTLLKMLDDQGLTDNTLVIAVSEQGSSFPFAKWTCFELGLASGMICRWPDKIQAGSISDALVEYCDVTPTFLEAAGLNTPPTMDGQSFLPVLLSKTLEHKKYTFGLHTTRGIINGSEHFAIRSCGTKTHRYIRNYHSEIAFSNTVTATNAKAMDPLWGTWIKQAEQGDAHATAMIAKYTRRPPEELYDVANDPHCLKNLIDKESVAAIKTELSNQLDVWLTSQADDPIQTEATAGDRQGRSRKKTKGNKGKKKK